MLNTEQYGFVVARAPQAEPDRSFREVFMSAAKHYFGNDFFDKASFGDDDDFPEWYMRGSCGYTLSLQIDLKGVDVEITAEYAHAHRNDHIQTSATATSLRIKNMEDIISHAEAKLVEKTVKSVASKFLPRLRDLAASLQLASTNASQIANNIKA